MRTFIIFTKELNSDSGNNYLDPGSKNLEVSFQNNMPNKSGIKVIKPALRKFTGMSFSPV